MDINTKRKTYALCVGALVVLAALAAGCGHKAAPPPAAQAQSKPLTREEFMKQHGYKP